MVADRHYVIVVTDADGTNMRVYGPYEDYPYAEESRDRLLENIGTDNHAIADIRVLGKFYPRRSIQW